MLFVWCVLIMLLEKLYRLIVLFLFLCNGKLVKWIYVICFGFIMCLSVL